MSAWLYKVVDLFERIVVMEKSAGVSLNVSWSQRQNIMLPMLWLNG